MTQRLMVLCALVLGLATLALSGCAPTGMHLHVASATPAQIQAASNEDTVWYEFREGDEVPFQFLVFGDAASAGPPTTLLARRHFWLILSKGRQLQISYNGTTASTDQMEFILTVVAGDDGKAKVIWLNHMGTGDPEEALRRLMGPAE